MNHSTIKNSFKKRKKENVFFSLGIVFLLVVWTIFSFLKNNIFFPNIIEVIKDVFKLLTLKDTLWIILLTIIKLIVVIIIAYFISFIIALFSYKCKNFRAFIAPMIAFMRSIPVASVIIILILLIGTTTTPMIITLFVIIPIASENIYTSFSNIDKDIIEETRLLSNMNKMVLFKVYIPLTAPYIFSSLLASFGLGLKVLVMGEVLTQGTNTIGGQIQLARTTLESVRVFSWTFILIMLVLVVEEIIKLTEKKMAK